MNPSFPTYAPVGGLSMDRPDVDIGRMLPRDGFASTDVRFGSEADLVGAIAHVRKVPEADLLCHKANQQSGGKGSGAMSRA